MATKKTKVEIDPIVQRAKLFCKEDFEFYLGDLTDTPEVLLKRVVDLSKGCTDCILSEGRNHVCGPDGTYGAPILIVSEKPGNLEDLAGLPMIGHQELRGSHCNNCNKIFSCFDANISWGHRRPQGVKRAIVCKPNPNPLDQLQGAFNLYSTGGVLDGLIQKKYNMVFPRHNWVEFYEKRSKQIYPYKSPWYITNAVLCRPWNKETGFDMTPPNLAISTCKKWLAMQYSILQPKVTIIMGKIALQSMLGEKARLPVCEMVEHKKYGKLIFIPHLAASMRIKDEYRRGLALAVAGKAFDMALTEAGLIIDGQLQPIKSKNII